MKNLASQKDIASFRQHTRGKLTTKRDSKNLVGIIHQSGVKEAITSLDSLRNMSPAFLRSESDESICR